MSLIKDYRILKQQINSGRLSLACDSIFRKNPSPEEAKVLKVAHDYLKGQLSEFQPVMLEEFMKLHHENSLSIESSVAAMIGVDVFHLPFTSTAFLTCYHSDNMRISLAAMVEEVDDAFEMNVFVKFSGKDRWLGQPVHARVYVRDGVLGYETKTYAKEWVGNFGEKAMGAINLHLQVSVDLMKTCIVLMSTRGIRTERVSARTKLKYRDDPEYSYHKIVIPGGGGTGPARGPMGERNRVRLHMRRGFERENQPHGPGRTLRKRTWVRPTLVGYEEEGCVRKHYTVRGEDSGD